MKVKQLLGMYSGDQSKYHLSLPSPKKYVLQRTTAFSANNTQFNYTLKRNSRKQEPTYLTNILKQQKKNLFITTFLRKIKGSIPLATAPQSKFLEQDKQTEQDQQNQFRLRLPNFVQLIILFLWAFQAFLLIVTNSLAIVFAEINNSPQFRSFIIFSIIFHLVQIITKFFVHFQYQQNKLFKFKEISQRYLKFDFWIDFIVFVSLAMLLILNSQSQSVAVFRILIFIKIKDLMYIIEHLQITLIQNMYREQIWLLIKVFLSNFAFAHVLALLLVFMARLNPENNWIVKKQIQDQIWIQQYIWAYYWAVTIMLTVGFGDITAVNSKQALCMIFIQTVSCILFAYNINCVGNIIKIIRSYDLQKNGNLKIFNHINEKSEFNDQTRTRIMNFVKQSTQMKRNFNIVQQKQFINQLPSSFQIDIKRQMNRHIWNGMKFFHNLSETSLIKLSIMIQKKLAHPEQIVYEKGNFLGIIVFNQGKFGYSYNNGNSKRNGKLLQHFNVSSNQYQVASFDFLFQNKLNYDIKSTDYSIFYKISTDELLKILKDHSYDSEYFFMIKDKDKFILNEFEFSQCQICPKEKHSVFKCQKIHYVALKQHIIRKHKDKYFQKLYGHYAQRDYDKMTRSLKDQRKIRRQIQVYSRSISQLLEKSLKTNGQLPTQIFTETNFLPINLNQNNPIQQQYSGIQNNTKFYTEAMDQIKQKLDNLVVKPKFQWDLQSDQAFNYELYFRNYNPDQISSKFQTKKPKAATAMPLNKFKRRISYYNAKN